MFNIFIVLFLFFFLGISALLIFLHNTQTKEILLKKIQPMHFVLTVRNMEESIECIVRSVVWKTQNYKEKDNLYPQELIILDLDSTDNTLLILNSLAKEYPFIHPMTKTNYISYIESFD